MLSTILSVIILIVNAQAISKVVPIASTVPALPVTSIVPQHSSSFAMPSVSSSIAAATAINSVSLQRGDVFGLVTISKDDRVNGETVVIYNDGTLGVKEPTGPGYLFEALLLPEYNLVVAPEPLTTVKINDKGVFYLNTSLFNPSPIFGARDWELNVSGGNPVVCPSWNSVLVLAKDNENVPCEDAISVSLGIVPITVD